VAMIESPFDASRDVISLQSWLVLEPDGADLGVGQADAVGDARGAKAHQRDALVRIRGQSGAAGS